MKAIARYQVILLGEQRHIRCEQLAQGCCPNIAAVGVESATYWSWVQRPTATPPSHQLKWELKCTNCSHCILHASVSVGETLKASTLRHDELLLWETGITISRSNGQRSRSLEGKCKTSFVHVFVKDGSIYVKVKPRTEWYHPFLLFFSVTYDELR